MIRKAAESDFDNYKKLRNESLRDYSRIEGKKLELSIRELRKEFESLLKHGILLFCEEKKIAVGFVSATLFFEPEKFVYVNDLLVSRLSRGVGVAKSLFSELEIISKKRKAKKLVINIRVNNSKALRLYDSLEFKTVTYEMEKKL